MYRLERHTENRWWSRRGPNNLEMLLTRRWIERLEATLFYTPACATLARSHHALCVAVQSYGCVRCSFFLAAGQQLLLAQCSWDMYVA